MSRVMKLSILFSLVFVAYASPLALVQPRAHFAVFDGLSCSTCEGVMNVVSKQIPKTEELGKMGKSALKLAIKGACAYYTLGVPPALLLCTAMTGKIADFLADDVLGRTASIIPKSNCRSIGMCPPCKNTNKKLVMVQKKSLPLPWDTHNKHQHTQMREKYEAEQAKKMKVKFHAQQLNHSLALSPAHNKLMSLNVKCYACKSVMGMVGHDVSNVKAAGKDMVISLIKQQCLNYVTGIPFSENICDLMVKQSVGKLADDVMGKGQIQPGQNCRTIGMCPACNGPCDDEVEVDKGKKAKDTPLPPVDDTCDEPPITEGIPCTDNFDKCKSGKDSCEAKNYITMMRSNCMFTCVCRWLPKFSDLTSYLPGK
jgi:hypothetical protein